MPGEEQHEPIEYARFMVLQSLRWIGVSGEDRLAGVLGFDHVHVARHLDELANQGWVHGESGPFGGWGLTDAGRAEANRQVKVELEGTGSRPRVQQSYESFRLLNPVVLSICHDWQMRRVGQSVVMNDHRDADYDAVVLDRLIRAHEDADRLLSDIPLERFGIHRRRLDDALRRALAGETAYVTDSLDAYHTVWFQLHEDLLSTLGLSRDDERGPGG
ncbi:MAG TPA: transcriptional regulator [Acidimicrobiia bacterium]|nr:transcriptional regulator [Acidimicrobiia bacterium]